MKICFLTEGSYPYMIGGLSSWLNLLIEGVSDNNIRVFSLWGWKKDKGNFLSSVHKNIECIKEYFLDSAFEKLNTSDSKKYVRNDNDREVLINHFSGVYSDWPKIFELLTKKEFKNIVNFFSSTDFYEVADLIYKKYFENMSYLEFIWSLRSMYIYQFHVLKAKIPDADINHCICSGFPSIIASQQKVLRGKPFLLTEHGIYQREREEEFLKNIHISSYERTLWLNFYKGMSQCGYLFADKVITQFERNRKYQIDQGVDINKTCIIGNGIDLDKYKSNIGIKREEKIVIGAIARIVPIKDIITMLKSFEIIKKHILNIKLVIVGPSDEDENYSIFIKDFIKESKLKDVEFMGRVRLEEYKIFLEEMDIFLLTSISEGQPISVLEAMASGKPLVLTDVGSCRELIYGNDDGIGEAGIISGVMDYKSIAMGVIRLAKDKGLRNAMGSNARKRVEKSYTLEKMASKYNELYLKFGRE